MNDQKPLNKNELASQQTREKLLQATIEVIGREGYVALTANRLSQEAGISKGALYHHFKNLDDLRLSALAHLLTLFEPAEPADGSSLRSYLDALGQGIFARLREQPVATKALYAYIAQALVDESLKPGIRELISQGLEEYARVIGACFPGLSQAQKYRIVLLLDAYFGGSVLHWFLLDDEQACLAGWRQFSAMLIATLEDMEP